MQQANTLPPRTQDEGAPRLPPDHSLPEELRRDIDNLVTLEGQLRNAACELDQLRSLVVTREGAHRRLRGVVEEARARIFWKTIAAGRPVGEVSRALALRAAGPFADGAAAEVDAPPRSRYVLHPDGIYPHTHRVKDWRKQSIVFSGSELAARARLAELRAAEGSESSRRTIRSLAAAAFSRLTARKGGAS
jgi:hypothetical protein